MLDQYAVMGNPIGHSKSPHIHRLFAEQTGQQLTYRAILVDIGDFNAAVERFRATGGKGLNITIPFKQEAYAYATDLSARATRAGAVNTLQFKADRCFGDNTDGAGLVRDLTDNHKLLLQGIRILLLGAGGAARGVLQPLLQKQPEQLVIANRTKVKAIGLEDDFKDLGPVQGCGFDDIQNQSFDLIINATAAGLNAEIPPLPETALKPNGFCYDMVYADQATAFVTWAFAHGARHAVDGRGMLIEQAAESFLLWRGIRPNTASLLQQFATPAASLA